MMKKTVKILAAVVAAVLIAGVLFVYNAFCGNIFSAMYAKYQIEQHISEHFADKSYEISAARYEFKTGLYTCDIIDPNSADGSFTASYSGGEVYDDYDIMVTQMQNTVMRLDDGFRYDVEPILDKYLTDSDFGYGTIFCTDDGWVDTSRLTLDMAFDTKNMPVPTCITASMSSDEKTSLDKIKTIVRALQGMGYRIDYCEYSNAVNYYKQVPVDKLLEAESGEALASYRPYDGEKEPAIE